MSIRQRLTLLYTGILIATLLVLGAVLYATVVLRALNGSSNRLMHTARQLAIGPASGRADLADHLLQQNDPDERDAYVQLFAPDGTTRSRSANLGTANLPLGDAARASVAATGEWRGTATMGSESVQIVAVPARDGGIIAVGRSLAEQQQTFAVLRDILLIVGSAATLIALAAGWWLSGAALRPIDHMTTIARTIEVEHDFSRRVDASGPQDEVGRLATTFNEMLAALQSAFQQMEHTLQAQRRFVADASHELRTPLTTIRGNLALLQREPPIDEEDRVAVIADSIDETERLSRLVNQLLTLARVDAGVPIPCEPLDLREIAEAAIRRVQPLAAAHTLRGPCGPQVVVEGNRDALMQVLMILLDNALKFTPAGGDITVVIDADAQHGMVSVRDSGPGIAPEVQSALFERFVRGDPARVGEGAGLGLAIAHDLLAAQHGSIAVMSQPGQGSTFTFSLPRAHVAEDAQLAALPALHDGG